MIHQRNVENRTLLVQVGILRRGQRYEKDQDGPMRVPADRYWGARTERSRKSLCVGSGSLPPVLYRSYGRLKRSAAIINAEMGRLAAWKAEAVIRAADDLISGALDAHFPLTAYHSGSGYEFDMNVNEVLANRAIQLLAGRIGSEAPVHPVLDVGMAQRPAAAFAFASRLAIVLDVEARLVRRATALARRIDAMAAHSRKTPHIEARASTEWRDDPSSLWTALANLDESEGGLHDLPPLYWNPGSVEGTPDDFSVRVVADVAKSTKKPFVAITSANAESTIAPIAVTMASLRGLADVLLSYSSEEEAIRCASSNGCSLLRPWSAGRGVGASGSATISVAHSGFRAHETAVAASLKARPGTPSLATRSILEGADLLASVCKMLWSSLGPPNAPRRNPGPGRRSTVEQ